MDNATKVALGGGLVRWYQAHRRALPWRETKDPYGIWVSEVMLQQTRVETVIPYYRRFMAAFPTVGDLAAADLQAVLKRWEGLGYYARARNLHRAAGQVVAAHGGRVPDDHQALRDLPGIGDYIAAAVMSIAFGRPYAVVDGNVKRVLSRILLLDAPVNRHDAYPVFEREARSLMGVHEPGCFNQSMMELGALVCRPKRPLCEECPVAGACRARRAGKVDLFPVRIRKPPVPTRAMAAGMIRKNGRVLIVQIPPDGLLGGLWEFPGGAVVKGEPAEAACARHILRQTGLSVAGVRHLGRIRHAYTHFKVVVDLFSCRWQSGTVRLDGPADFRWVGLDALGDFPLPKTHHKFMPLIVREDG